MRVNDEYKCMVKLNYKDINKGNKGDTGKLASSEMNVISL